MLGFDRGKYQGVVQWWASLPFLSNIGHTQKYIVDFLKQNRLFCFWYSSRDKIILAAQIDQEFISQYQNNITARNLESNLFINKTLQKSQFDPAMRYDDHRWSDSLRQSLLEINAQMYPPGSVADYFMYIWSGHATGNGDMISGQLRKTDAALWLSDLVARRNSRKLDMCDVSLNCLDATPNASALHARLFNHILSSSQPRGTVNNDKSCRNIGPTGWNFLGSAPMYLFAAQPWLAFSFIKKNKNFSKNYTKLVLGTFLLRGADFDFSHCVKKRIYSLYEWL